MKTSKVINFEGNISHYSGYMSKIHIEEYHQAKNILSSAEERAKKLCEQSQADYESELDRGYEEGKKKSDREMSEAMMLHSKRTIEHLMSIEQELIHIVDKSLRQIIGEFDQADLIKKVVVLHVQDVRVENSVTLKVHSDMLSRVKECFCSVPDVENVLTVIPDNNIKSTDGFVLETPSGRMESGVSMQLETLIDSFRQNF